MARRHPGRGAWRRAGAAVVAAAGLGAALPAAASATDALDRALDHLARWQDPRGGGFSDDARGTRPGPSAWAALAVAGAGQDPAGWSRGGASLRRAVWSDVARLPLADLERTAVAAAASGLDPRALDGRNAVREIVLAQAADGAIGDDVSSTAWGLLALRAAGLPAGSRAIRLARASIERRQRGDGGWARTASPGSDPNSTSVAVQAVVAAGADPVRSPSLRRARAYLRAAQHADGGFGPVPGSPTTALTTAWVAVGLSSMGVDLRSGPWSRGGGPLAALRRLQQPDGGLRNAPSSGTTSIWATSQAVLAFTGRPLPLGAHRSAEEVRPASAPTR
ncbi:MAG: prenyltransferase/squalene oxidase repeat-containing protein [Thermoleophilia bacterium]